MKLFLVEELAVVVMQAFLRPLRPPLIDQQLKCLLDVILPAYFFEIGVDHYDG